MRREEAWLEHENSSPPRRSRPGCWSSAKRYSRPTAPREGMRLYYATFRDVGGLNSGADVRFGGVQVGTVESVEIDPADPTRIRVAAMVPETVPVNAGSVASIQQISLTAEMHLEISTGDRDRPVLENGAVLESETVATGLFDVPDVEGVIAPCASTRPPASPWRRRCARPPRPSGA